MSPFATLPLLPALIEGLAALEFNTMTPVQAAALPPVLAGRDVIAQARTGSGKTAVFALGMLNRIDIGRTALQGLVLCPTRELADQVSREIRRIARPLPNVKVLTLCGGVPLRPHLASLAHVPHIVVGTPGRILELIAHEALPLDDLITLVLDEADRMLDMGFLDDIQRVIAATPAGRQTLLFSATYPDGIRTLCERVLREPESIAVDLEPESTQIEQQAFELASNAHKFDALTDLLMLHRPESVAVFCNTRHDTRALTEYLDRRGFSVLALHGDLDQRERDEMLLRFANRSCTVLVATDVAARGLDIKDLPLVINFDLASDADTHTHRIGRTGRAGARGLALTLFTEREAHRLAQIEAQTSQRLQRLPLPRPSGSSRPLLARFVCIAIDAGRTDKLRPGDVLGALTGSAGLSAEAIGKIDIFPTRSYVAVARELADRAIEGLRAGKIKGRSFRVRRIG